MKSADCYAARGIDLFLGIFLVLVGIALVFTGFSFLPFIGFFLAFVAFWFSTYFLFAPPDRTCFWRKKVPKPE